MDVPACDNIGNGNGNAEEVSGDCDVIMAACGVAVSMAEATLAVVRMRFCAIKDAAWDSCLIIGDGIIICVRDARVFGDKSDKAAEEGTVGSASVSMLNAAVTSIDWSSLAAVAIFAAAVNVGASVLKLSKDVGGISAGICCDVADCVNVGGCALSLWRTMPSGPT